MHVCGCVHPATLVTAAAAATHTHIAATSTQPRYSFSYSHTHSPHNHMHSRHAQSLPHSNALFLHSLTLSPPSPARTHLPPFLPPFLPPSPLRFAALASPTALLSANCCTPSTSKTTSSQPSPHVTTWRTTLTRARHSQTTPTMPPLWLWCRVRLLGAACCSAA